MIHPERKKARRFDSPYKSIDIDKIVYGGDEKSPSEMYGEIGKIKSKYDPAPPEYHPFIGEMHGHTNLSDGKPDIDKYFRRLRDEAKVDFAALTDHDHGGVGKKELWVGTPSKWDIIKEKVKEYYEPGKFTTILAYERDSYPWYSNMILYYGTHDGEMIRSENGGRISENELRSILKRDDVFPVPHDTYAIESGTDFVSISNELIPPFIEVCSRGDAAEYMHHPAFAESECCEGCFWQDALRKGAKIGCIGGSDDHDGTAGLVVPELGYPYMYPGLTGVWAKENTLPAIFEALRAKRTFAFMGGNTDQPDLGRIIIDFRINGHYMGEEITPGKDEELEIWFKITTDTPIKWVTIVKNCRDYIGMRKDSRLIFDYQSEQETDSYYLRVELADGRFGWTSPIWVNRR